MRAVISERSKWLPPPPPPGRGVTVRPPGRLRAVRRTAISWAKLVVNRGLLAARALRGDGADDVLERDLLVREGVQDDLADVGDVLGERGGGIERMRSARVLTRNPIRPAVSGWPRPETGVPMVTSRLPEWRARKMLYRASRTTKSVVAALVRAASSQARAAGPAVILAWSPEKSARSGAAWSGAGLAGSAPSSVSLPPGQVVVGRGGGQLAVPGGVVRVLDSRIWLGRRQGRPGAA